MRTRTRALLAAMLSAPMLQTAAQVDPGDDPELTGDSAARRGSELLADAPAAPAAVTPADAPRFNPARPHRPEHASGPGRLLPDGSFLVEQQGSVRKTASGAWVFVPSIDETGEQFRPMIVLPSQILGRLQRIVGDEGNEAAVRLTGRVTLFRTQNYLLITAISDQSLTPPDEPPAETDAANTPPEEGDGLSGSVESLIEELEAERTGVRAVITSLGGADDSVIAPVAEGRMISRRRGRFVRLDAGELAIAFDNDATTDAPLDAPLVIAPCSLLESVEATLEAHGDAVTATVSGQTLAFAGRSFLLPVSIVIDRPSEFTSRQ